MNKSDFQPRPPRIRHLTVLNPAIHTRIFYKLACSQAAAGYEVHVHGQGREGQTYVRSGVHIHPTRPFGRLSWRRFVHTFRLLGACLPHPSEVYVLHSPELLPLGWVLKHLHGARLVYDLHEDYRVNILNAPHYPAWLRRPLAAAVRRFERLFVPGLQAVTYAEACYDNVLKMPDGRKYVLRNSFSARAAQGTPTVALPAQPYFLYTGTLAKAWGIWDALALWEKVRRLQPFSLAIAGFTYDRELIRALRQWIAEHEFKADVRLIGGDRYVPYVDVLHLLQHAYVSLALYQVEPHIQGKIPTKFYEALANGKPLVYRADPFWDGLNRQWQLGVSYHADKSASLLLEELEAWHAQPPLREAGQFDWQTDEALMRKMLDAVLKKD